MKRSCDIMRVMCAMLSLAGVVVLFEEALSLSEGSVVQSGWVIAGALGVVIFFCLYLSTFCGEGD